MSAYKGGWIRFEDRTSEQNENHERILSGMSKFSIMGATVEQQKILLTDVWVDPRVISIFGREYPGIKQITGSCVGAGGGNVNFTLSAIEVIKEGQNEQITFPCWLFTYGKSRQRGGLRGRGEGSFGSAYAEAAKLDGYISSNMPGVPEFDYTENGIVYSSDEEMEWSHGAAINTKFVEEGRKHLVRSTAQLRNSDEARQAILNGYPITIACNYYVGSGSIKGSGSNQVVVGKLDTYGPHQTSIQGFWDHPTLGYLFLYVNQWGKGIYPKDPAGGPVSSVWITAKDVDYICQKGEIYAFSQYDGFPAQDIDKALFRIMG